MTQRSSLSSKRNSIRRNGAGATDDTQTAYARPISSSAHILGNKFGHIVVVAVSVSDREAPSGRDHLLGIKNMATDHLTRENRDLWHQADSIIC